MYVFVFRANEVEGELNEKERKEKRLHVRFFMA